MAYQPNLDVKSLPQMPRPDNWAPWRPVPPPKNAEKNRRFITKYGSHPLDIFTPAVNMCTAPDVRWVYTEPGGKHSLFIFTDGAAPSNGQPGARAGCGVMLSPLYPGFSFPLENSPEGHEPTSNRAELRAVIEPLEMRVWRGEGFDRLVIGTDSEYVIKGISEWTLKWKKNGWKTSTGAQVKNMDLWKLLLKKVEKLENEGLSVQFFQLKKEWNEETRALARKGALSEDVPNEIFETIYMPSYAS